jgi:hypothetical protein
MCTYVGRRHIQTLADLQRALVGTMSVDGNENVIELGGIALNVRAHRLPDILLLLLHVELKVRKHLNEQDD